MVDCGDSIAGTLFPIVTKCTEFNTVGPWQSFLSCKHIAVVVAGCTAPCTISNGDTTSTAVATC